MKRSSQAEVEQRLSNLNIEYDPFEYINNNQIINYKCPICKSNRSQKIGHIFKRRGLCVSCGNKKYDQESIELKLKSLNIIYRDFEYESNLQKIEVKCPNCSNYKTNSITNLIGGRTGRCGKCVTSSNTGIKYNQKTIEIRLTECGISFPTFKYKTVNQNIEHYCPDCGLLKTATITNLLRGFSKCETCKLVAIKTKNRHSQQYVEEYLSNLNIEYEPFVYSDNRQLIKFKCSDCNILVDSSFHDISLRKTFLCNICHGKTKQISIEKMKNTLNELGLKYTPFERNGSRIEIQYECPSCGELTSASYNSIQQKVGINCRSCLNYSKMEEDINLKLNDKHIVFKREHTEDWLKNPETTRNLFLDFYLPEYNIAIECQGEQHFVAVKHFGGEEAFYNTQKRDKVKKELCEEHGIKIFYINYNENAEKKLEQILNEIRMENTND